MRWSAAATAVLIIACLVGSRQQPSCAVTLQLVDAAEGRRLPGLLRIADAEGQSVPIPELLSRGVGLKGQLGVAETAPIHQWSVLPTKTVVHLPQAVYSLTAFSGLETESVTQKVDLSGRDAATISLALPRFDDPASRGYFSANTHLHLMKIDRSESDRYLREVPRGDDLDGLFVSYLERAVADRDYITNHYSRNDLQDLARRSGVLLGNGEEHRHNLAGNTEGYGHVMLLNIQQLIQPVSIGPGIMKMGTDGIPLQRGIDAARDDGATIVWCHNLYGFENLPNVLAGRIDAQNIFDGGSRDSYKDSFYRYLNIGLRLPFSTGTDWFMYDFSRVYAKVDRELTVENWLSALADGRSFINNGTLLEFQAGGQDAGSTLQLDKPGPVDVVAHARGRIDFGRLELIRNGSVIASAPSQREGNHYTARLVISVDQPSPGWLAIRTPPPPVKDDPALQQPVPQNELGRDLFAHSSAIYVNIAGADCFDEQVARELLAELRENRQFIAEHAEFADRQERERVLDVHRDAIADLQDRIERHAR